MVDLQKTIAEGENKLKQQQKLYEAVRSDRNLYSKNLIKAQDEIQEMKRKFKILNHQIEQLKEEIGAKDLALVKEHSDFVKVEKEKESLRLDLNKARQQIMEAEGTIASQKAETVKLNHIINEADAERLRQKKEYDMVINERDILGTQLIRRNDELALLYEKIKIQQSTLAKGQTQYRDRMKEARLVKIKLNDLKRELHILKNSVANIDVLKREGTLYRIANILNSHSCSQPCKRRTGIPSTPPRTPPAAAAGRRPAWARHAQGLGDFQISLRAAGSSSP